MKFKFELISPDGQNVGSFESTVLSWRPGDTVIASGNIAYKVVNVIRLKRIAEFVHEPLCGVLEVEPLAP